MMRAVLPLLVATALFSAPQPVFPPGVKPVGPYSPGLIAGDLVYVSGQGARDAKNQLAPTPEGQVRQTLENVKAVLQAAGVTMEHVVYAQTYLADIKHYDILNRVWAQYFPKNPPARSTIAVVRMPTDTPFEVAAIAVRDLKAKKVVQYPGRRMPVLTGALGREFNTGAVPKEPRAQMKLVMDSSDTVLKAAGMELRHLVYVNIYVSPQMPMKALADAIDEYIPDETAKTVIQTAALPFGVHVQISGVASRNLKRLGNCTAVGETAYCAGRGGTITQALTSLKQDLEANKLSLANVVASNVYVDSIDEFAAMNKIYATFFGTPYPTRTTVQPYKGGGEIAMPPATGAPQDNSPRAMVSVIAVR
jgi:2-iminobutanoate/2-iminopropanoate deaminase